MINICKDHGIIEPVFEEKPNGFIVTVFKKKLKETDVPENDSDRVTDKDPDRVPDRVPDRDPDRVPDRVPEHLTGFHCFNVTDVGAHWYIKTQSTRQYQ